ncbi:major histocompatibility complex class I-related gene protein-like isoform X2 [Parambassis ranga]|nr:major histocompatibility complex class I-related gene protein-like isoform X2 [Parambassis ranga]
MKIFMLFLFCYVVSSVKHSMKFYLTSSFGVPEFPDFVARAMVNDVEIAYYDSNAKKTTPKHLWMKNYMSDDQWQRSTQNCRGYHQLFKAETKTFMQRLNHTGGIHVLQEMAGCEWDNETGEINGYQQYGYNGEDFISLDLNTLTWVAPKPQAVVTKHEWDRDKPRTDFWRSFIRERCPEKLKKYLMIEQISRPKRDPPSLSLLQKTPSSAVSCHATGFYPDRALMFWSKDGEEIHEGVEHGEILPNHDGTFQMSVDLNVSSVPEEDRRRYHCVFQFVGAVDRIITGLNEAAIKTNREKSAVMTIPIMAAVAVLAAIIGFLVVTHYRRTKTKCPPCPPDNTSELSELNPEA